MTGLGAPLTERAGRVAEAEAALVASRGCGCRRRRARQARRTTTSVRAVASPYTTARIASRCWRSGAMLRREHTQSAEFDFAFCDFSRNARHSPSPPTLTTPKKKKIKKKKVHDNNAERVFFLVFTCSLALAVVDHHTRTRLGAIVGLDRN